MAVDGTWNLTMTTPIGERKATLEARAVGGKLEGRQAAEDGSADIFDGTVSGNTIGWKVKINQPMPMTLEFSATIDGNSMSGTMGTGMFGSFPFTGTRG